LVSNQKLETEVDKLKDHVAEVNRFNASKRDCAKDKQELLVKVDKLENDLMTL